MRLSPFALGSAALLLYLPGAFVLPSVAQTFPAITGILPVPGGDLPERVPSALPAHHDRTDASLMYARVRDGVYSVDGMVGKVRLNYDVNAARYLYLFMPGVGTALVSLAPAKDTVSVLAAYHDGEITVRVGEHTLTVTGVESLVNDRGKEPEALYVRLDRSAWRLSRTPMVGYGNTTDAPYEWPGALHPAPVAAEPDTPSLPVPVNLLPRLAAAAGTAPGARATR